MTWIKRKLALMAFALSKAEVTTLHQREDGLISPEGMSQTHNQGSILDSLKKGELTLPVKELRWRLYKVLNESKGRAATITGYDEEGLPIVKTYSINDYKLDNIICDKSDSYPVEMVVKNDMITYSTHEVFNKFDANNVSGDTITVPKQEMFEIVGQEMSGTSFTHVEVSFDDMMSEFKESTSLILKRETRPKFELENYTKKMIVRNISDDEKLLEFYVSSYPDEFNRKSRLFINEVKRAIKNPRFTDMLDITKVNFISNKTIGVIDGLEYEYEIKKFDKIVEFNGSYVIKFIGNVIINGDNIFEKYKLDDLEKRYLNKEAK